MDIHAAIAKLNEGKPEWTAEAAKQWTPAMPSRGLGDTVAKITHRTGIAGLVKTVARHLGRDCGCDERQARLNSAMPYKCKSPAWRGYMPTEEPMPPIEVCDLAYFVYPALAKDTWRKNLQQLRKRWAVFNGRAVFAIATGPDTHPVAEVLREIGHDVESFEVRNDPGLRETVATAEILRRLKSTDSNRAFFYAHTKGGSDLAHHAQYKIVREGEITHWRNTMYHRLLDDPAEVLSRLRHFPAVGTYHGQWSPPGRWRYPTNLRHGRWLFCGSFWWARSDRVFGHPKWDDVPRDIYGTEAYLSGLFEPEQGYSMWQPWPLGTMPPKTAYAGEYHEVIEDE